MVEALKQRFAAEIAERDLRHRAEVQQLRQSHAAEIVARDEQHAAQLRGVQKSAAADAAARDERHRGELQTRHETYVADAAARDEHYMNQLRALQQTLDQVGAQLRDVAAGRDAEAQARAAADHELQARRAQVAAQHLELETAHDAIAQLTAQVAEVSQALASERMASAQADERVKRLEEHLRHVVAESHRAALDAAGHAMDLHDDAVKRGDHLADELALHEAAVGQLRSTIEQQRADRDQLMQERQEARDRCVALESQLHALTMDARHLAEGLRRAEAERDADHRGFPEPVPEIVTPPKLRLAGTGDSA